MQINTTDGMRNVASQGQANVNSVLGAVGTVLGLANGGAQMFGWNRNRGENYGAGFGYGANGYGSNGYFNNFDPNSRLITKAEFDLGNENTNLKSENAVLKSEKYTDQKIVEAVTYVNGQIKEVRQEMQTMRERQDDFNRDQIAFNERTIGGMNTMKTQLRAIEEVTETFVPQSKICHQGCGCGCGCNNN